MRNFVEMRRMDNGKATAVHNEVKRAMRGKKMVAMFRINVLLKSGKYGVGKVYLEGTPKTHEEIGVYHERALVAAKAKYGDRIGPVVDWRPRRVDDSTEVDG